MPALEEALLFQVLDEFSKSLDDFNTFVETGTFMGDTAHMASRLFKKVYTIEIYEPLYLEACKRFSNTNVEVIFGDSIETIPSILNDTLDDAVFWLDGHNSGPGTGVGRVDFPLINECILIDNLYHAKEALILVDDVRLFGNGHSSQIDDSLLTLTIDKVLQTFTKRKIVKHCLYPSSLATNDRLAILIS